MNIGHPLKMCVGGYWKIKRKFNLIGKYVIVGVAAQWGKRKGLQDFIKLNGMFESSYQVILVGLSAEEAKGVPDSIKAVARTNSTEELQEIYSIADVFVNPTHQDNFPTTNIECLACGTPVITYKTGGSPEAVSRDTGRIVVEGNVYGLLEEIEGMKEHYLSIEKCIERSRHFTRETMTKKYRELY